MISHLQKTAYKMVKNWLRYVHLKNRPPLNLTVVRDSIQSPIIKLLKAILSHFWSPEPSKFTIWANLGLKYTEKSKIDNIDPNNVFQWLKILKTDVLDHGLLKEAGVQLGKYGKIQRRPVFQMYVGQPVLNHFICSFLKKRDNLFGFYAQ